MNWEAIGYSAATVGIIFAVIAIFYYFSTAKNIKKQHARYEKLLNEIKPGNKVVFAGGLVGVVESVDADRVFAKIRLNNSYTIQATVYSISNVLD